MRRSTRLVALVQALQLRRAPATAKGLAQEFGTSERTIYRDICELVAHGVPIEGTAGVGYVIKLGLFLPPLMLTEAELKAVLAGLGDPDERTATGLSNPAKTALKKILALLPQDIHAELCAPAFQAPAHVGVPAPVPKEGRGTVRLDVLRQARETRKRLALVYVDKQGRRIKRVVWPIVIDFKENIRLLIGWTEQDEAFRSFPVEELASAELLDSYPANFANLMRLYERQFRNRHRFPPAPEII
jgi:predicted DNA-binding transcriptional regulator YafY